MMPFLTVGFKARHSSFKHVSARDVASRDQHWIAFGGAKPPPHIRRHSRETHKSLACYFCSLPGELDRYCFHFRLFLNNPSGASTESSHFKGIRFEFGTRCITVGERYFVGFCKRINTTP